MQETIDLAKQLKDWGQHSRASCASGLRRGHPARKAGSGIPLCTQSFPPNGQIARPFWKAASNRSQLRSLQSAFPIGEAGTGGPLDILICVSDSPVVSGKIFPSAQGFRGRVNLLAMSLVVLDGSGIVGSMRT